MAALHEISSDARTPTPPNSVRARPNQLVALKSSGMTFGGNRRASREEVAKSKSANRRTPPIRSFADVNAQSALQGHMALSPFGKCERSQAATAGPSLAVTGAVGTTCRSPRQGRGRD